MISSALSLGEAATPINAVTNGLAVSRMAKFSRLNGLARAFGDGRRQRKTASG
jgi:hypothetical protein